MGLVLCSILFTGYSADRSEMTVLDSTSEGTTASSDAGSDAELAKMQQEVKQQLVEAAKRRALAKKHREQAQELAAKAVEDRTAAEVLKRKSAYARTEAAVQSDGNAVKKAEERVRTLKEKAATRDAAADKDEAKADQLKEDILTLDDKAGTLSEQASEELARVAVVHSAAEKEAAGLPALLKKAVSTEARATKLKRLAQGRMADSTEKMERAGQLDALAAAKERQAREMRTRLVGILAAKTAALDRRQRQAAVNEELAKRWGHAHCSRALLSETAHTRRQNHEPPSIRTRHCIVAALDTVPAGSTGPAEW